MILVVGLGNPGQKYQKTRHNVGFMVLDEFQKIQDFSDWKLKKKFKAEISEGIINSQKIILAKPQTFMNESGKAVKAIFNFQFSNKNLIVIHDDLDLELGKMKIVQNRGAAGHKGVQSIINELGTKNFVRFRIGIAQKLKVKSEKLKVKVESLKLDEFVLQKFTKEENKILKGVIEKTCRAIEIAIKQSIEKAMTEYNK